MKQLIALTVLLALTAPAWAQGVQRSALLKADVAAPGREAVVVRVEIDAGARIARHRHPGDEISYVLEGEGELLVDGEPARRVKAGEAFAVAAGKVHAARNVGAGPLRVLAVYVVEKDQPLVLPAN
ncbi:MAG: cupin domain-containing protein [Pseudomonadota bacterium]